jgi:hypothetical protein
MKAFKCTISLLILCFLALNNASSQGCVAVRPMSCTATGNVNSLGLLEKNQWQISAGYRYFESFRHYRGDHEEKERLERNTEVVNTTHAIDFGVTYGITKRLSVTVNVPIIYYYRTSLYEHYGNSLTANPDQKRFGMGAQGIGDVRLNANYWILNPEKESLKGNFAVGLGIKAPTGNSNVQGEFHRRNSDGEDFTITRAVDQSIQLGDGGWGTSLELQGFMEVFNKGWLFASGFYMFNPQETNKTLTRGTLDNVDPLIAYHSIADQYAARLGLNYAALHKMGIAINLGARIEGIPSEDIIGGSEGFRRPGHIISVEPGISYMKGGFALALNVPVAVYRNRVKSYYDKADPLGQRHGDAAFADYLVNLNLNYRFLKKDKQHQPMEMN